MAVSLKHAFQSAKPDGADTSIVRPSDWNAEHVLTQASGKLLGRTSAGTGATEEITAGSGLALSAGTLTADVTSVAGRTGAVTLAVADVSGAAPTASPTFTGKAQFEASVSTGAKVNLGSGANVTSNLVDGDIWVEGNNFRWYGNGVTWRASAVGHTHLSTAITDSTTAGRALLTAADASAQRTSLGLGSASLSAATDFATAVHTHSLSALTQSGAATGQVPTWNGTAWTAQTPTTGVSSFNTRTGAVTLSSSDVTTALTYTPVNKAGDTMSGTLNLASNGLTVGTNQLVVSSGNIGVGLASPVRQISVSSSTQSTIQLTNTASGVTATDGFQFQFDGSFNYVWGYENVATVFGTNNTERLRIDASGRITMPYQPAFSAHGPYSGSIWTASSGAGSGYVLLYQGLLTNRGSHYNTTNGRFTAPVAGAYFFSASITSAGAYTGPELYLRKNGTAQTGGVIAYTNSGYCTASGSWVLTLAAGDYVDVYWQANNQTTAIDLSRAHFTGFLLG